jgi:hypothetical protein
MKNRQVETKNEPLLPKRRENKIHHLVEINSTVKTNGPNVQVHFCSLHSQEVPGSKHAMLESGITRKYSFKTER